MDTLKETESQYFIRTFFEEIKNNNEKESEKKILLLALEAKSNYKEFSEEVSNLTEEQTNIIQNKIFDIFNSTLENYSNDKEGYIREEQLILGENLSVFLKNIERNNDYIDDSIYNKIDSKINKIKTTLKKDNHKNKEEKLVEDLLNGKSPRDLLENVSGVFEKQFAFDKESLKSALKKIENEDYKKIISVLDNKYIEITNKISDAISSGIINEQTNFQTHYPSEHFSKGRMIFEQIILEAKREKEYGINKFLLKKVNPNYDQITESDLFLSRYLEDRTEDNINSLFFKNQKDSRSQLIDSVRRLTSEEFELVQEKTINKMKSDSPDELKKTILAIETLALTRKESLLDTSINSIKYYLNKPQEKRNEEARMQNSKNKSSGTFSKK
jgi:hypothetical protein